jgi:biotin carboxyl carrier protein
MTSIDTGDIREDAEDGEGTRNGSKPSRLDDQYPLRLDEAPPARRSFGRVLLRIVRLGTLAAVVAASAVLAVRQIQANEEAARRLPIKGGLLVANQIDVISTSPGTISAVLVEPGDWVEAGAPVAIVDAIRPAPGGGQQVVGTELRAPLAGRVAAAPHHAGEAVIAGQVLVQLYRPEDVHLEVRIENSGDALRLEPGMRGKVWTAGVDAIDVELVRINPGLLSGGQRVGLLTLDLRFEQIEVADPLLLGLAFDGWLDTDPQEEP